VHTLPHAPQLAVSLAVSTQAAPQVVLVAQSSAHTPLSQTCPEPQTLPHAPQFFGSELLSTQAPEHCAYPLLQVTAHFPPEQVATPFTVDGQALPHVPQLLRSASNF